MRSTCQFGQRESEEKTWDALRDKRMRRKAIQPSSNIDTFVCHVCGLPRSDIPTAHSIHIVGLDRQEKGRSDDRKQDGKTRAKRDLKSKGTWGKMTIYIIIRDCTRVGAFPRAFCVPNSVALASLTLQVVYWAIH